MRSEELVVRWWWDGGLWRGFPPPRLPGHMDAETFSFLMFSKSDSLLLRNSSEMRDDLTRNLLTLRFTGSRKHCVYRYIKIYF